MIMKYGVVTVDINSKSTILSDFHFYCSDEQFKDYESLGELVKQIIIESGKKPIFYE